MLASRAWGGDAGGCAIVAAVWVARVELESGPLAHVQRGESGLGGIGACASSGIVSVSWNVSLSSESSSESVTKADLLGSEDSRTGTLPFLGVSGGRIFGEGIALTFAVLPDEPDTDESLASLAEVHSPPVAGWGSVGTRFRRLPCRRHGVVQCREIRCNDDTALDRVQYGLFG